MYSQNHTESISEPRWQLSPWHVSASGTLFKPLLRPGAAAGGREAKAVGVISLTPQIHIAGTYK